MEAGEDQNLLATLTHTQALAVNLVAPASVVSQRFDAAVQVDEEGLQEGLPRVQRLHRLGTTAARAPASQTLLAFSS